VTCGYNYYYNYKTEFKYNYMIKNKITYPKNILCRRLVTTILNLK